MSEETLKREIQLLNLEIEKKNEEFRTLEMYMPKVNERKRKVIGRQLTRLNYTAGNKIAELNKYTTEHQ